MKTRMAKPDQVKALEACRKEGEKKARRRCANCEATRWSDNVLGSQGYRKIR
jgi:hypothetical protein